MRISLVLLVSLLGCGGGGGIGINDLPDEIEGAQCDRLVACDGAEDRTTCDAAVEIDAGEFGSLEAAVEDGSVKYDSGAAAACADAIGDTNCTFPGFHQEDPCDDVFTGTVPTGGACMFDLQCANRGECEQTDPSCDAEIACCAGTCVGSETESAVGGPCGDQMHFCAVNSYCKSPPGGTGTCTATITMEGATCDEIDACANPMYCNIDFQTGTGTCKKPAASGQACSRTDLLPCADNRDHCDPATSTCVRNIAVGAACATGQRCVSYASCINGTCVADIAAGGACQVDSGADCAGTLECIGGTCQQPPPSMTCSLP